MSLTPDAFHSISRQKILVIEPFSYTPHVEAGLEISELLAQQNDVTYIGPDRLRCITDEAYKSASRFLIQFSRKRYISRYLSSSVRTLTREELGRLAQKPTRTTISRLIDVSGDDLETVMFENLDLGMGIRSSLVSLTRDTAVNPMEHRNFALALARDTVWLYRVTRALIRKHGFDIIVLFNGRMAPVRAIRRACEETGTRYFVHERGSSVDKYAIYDCATPHQPDAYRDWVDTWWEYVGEPEKNARQFLARRRRGVPTNWYTHTRTQKTGELPAASGQKRVTFFTSSEDELAAIGDELRPDTRFCDQIQAFRAVGDACHERGFQYIIRLHPNTPPTAEDLMRAAHDASGTVVEPSSEVDSYALLDCSDIIFTQNSSIGIEAAAMGKPVFFTGRNLFESCTSIRRIKNESELIQAFESLGPVDSQDALKYANFFGCHGINHTHYEPRGILSGLYRGYDLNAPLGSLREMKLRFTRGGR